MGRAAPRRRVLRDGFAGKATPRDLQHFLRGFIDLGVIHKRAILTQVHLVDSLPRTSVGKLDKQALRTRLSEGAAKGKTKESWLGTFPSADSGKQGCEQ